MDEPVLLTDVEIQMIMDQTRRMSPYQQELSEEYAKTLKGRYDALISNGFTETQAMELLKARGTNL